LILDWIDKGVQLLFVTVPNKSFHVNPRFSVTHRNFIRKELRDLLAKGAVSVCRSKPHFICALNVVPKKGGKLRLIINLRPLNRHIRLSSFRNEDIRTKIDLINYGDQLCTIDLRDYFYHVPVHPTSRKYLGFMFENTCYHWNVLPFGLNLSPYYCAKVIRPVIAFLRISLLIRCQVYVDDFLVVATPHEIDRHLSYVVDTLTELGFLINIEKSDLVPSHCKLYIGFVVDCCGESGYPEIWVTPGRARKLRHSIVKLCSQRTCSARALSRVLGQCISMSMAVTFGKVMLRNAYSLLRLKSHWDSIWILDPGTLSDLQWWLVEMASPRKRVLQIRTVGCRLLVDASQTD
jgi:hypothetical protein